jgi:plastocyanin
MKKAMFLTLASVITCVAVLLSVYADNDRKSRGHNPKSPKHEFESLSSATVSFGAWIIGGEPMDRFPANPDTQFPRFSNHHALTPVIATIEAGGTVNFIIAGFHVVTVYDHGTLPDDIDISLLEPGRVPPIINDPNNRIYRGLDPVLLGPTTGGQDRVEAVQFENPGLYLVICSVLPHFEDGMFGFVRVVRNDKHY